MSQHFPFNPKTLRRIFWGLALAGGFPLAHAVRGVTRSEGLPAFVRIGMCVGLIVASAWMALQLRPRAGWGVSLHSGGVWVGRRSSSVPLEVTWDRIEILAPQGLRWGDVVLHDASGKRIVLSQRLFAHGADFRAMTEALEQHLPTPLGDA